MVTRLIKPIATDEAKPEGTDSTVSRQKNSGEIMKVHVYYLIDVNMYVVFVEQQDQQKETASKLYSKMLHLKCTQVCCCSQIVMYLIFK